MMQLKLKLNDVCPAERKADSELLPIAPTSSQPCCKPYVGSSFLFKGLWPLFYLERKDIFSFKKKSEKYRIASKEYNENGTSFIYYDTLDNDGLKSFEMKNKGRDNNVCWWVME